MQETVSTLFIDREESKLNNILKTIASAEEFKGNPKVVIDLSGELVDSLSTVKRFFPHYHNFVVRRQKRVDDIELAFLLNGIIDNIADIIDEQSDDCYLLVNNIELFPELALKRLAEVCSSCSCLVTVFVAQCSVNNKEHKDEITKFVKEQFLIESVCKVRRYKRS